MRLRNKPWIKEKILQYSDILVENPQELKGKWKEYFGNDKPIYIELGTGKGNFISKMALQNPEVNFIGFELQLGVIYYAVKKVSELGLKNTALVKMNINDILEVFEEGEIDRIYINFCDPWPKERHDKRRLTHHNYINKYKKLLKPKGEVHFKTDNKDLFEFSLEEFELSECPLKNVTYDLHNSDFKDNVMTEYEEKFSSRGNPIYRCEAILS